MAHSGRQNIHYSLQQLGKFPSNEKALNKPVQKTVSIFLSITENVFVTAK
jgi:hypothetical protein